MFALIANAQQMHQISKPFVLRYLKLNEKIKERWLSFTVHEFGGEV